MNVRRPTTMPYQRFPMSRDMPTPDFRRFGHNVIEWVANYFENPGLYPVLADCRPGELCSQLPVKGPDKGESMETILHDLDRLILPFVTHWNHPQFHGYFSISSSAPRNPWGTPHSGLGRERDPMEGLPSSYRARTGYSFLATRLDGRRGRLVWHDSRFRHQRCATGVGDRTPARRTAGA